MTRGPRLALLAAAAVLALAGCQQLPFGKEEQAQPAPPAPQITEDVLRQRAQDDLALGARQYDAGDFDDAVKSLSGALDHGLLSKPDQARARKLLAFIYCVTRREPLCRDEFRKAFEIHPEFSLTPAEDGHPIWGPVYRDVRAQLIAEREAGKTVAAAPEPLTKAQQLLAEGMLKYDAGEFKEAHRLLGAALTEGLKSDKDQVKAMKYLAFTLCLQAQYRSCRNQFIAIYDVDPAFDLSPAEAGHPSWTHTFAAAKRIGLRHAAEKARREARERARKAAGEKDKKD